MMETKHVDCLPDTTSLGFWTWFSSGVSGTICIFAPFWKPLGIYFLGLWFRNNPFLPLSMVATGNVQVMPTFSHLENDFPIVLLFSLGSVLRLLRGFEKNALKENQKASDLRKDWEVFLVCSGKIAFSWRGVSGPVTCAATGGPVPIRPPCLVNTQLSHWQALAH